MQNLVRLLAFMTFGFHVSLMCCQTKGLRLTFFNFLTFREQKERERQLKIEQEKEEKRRRQQEEERRRKEEEEKRRKAEKEKAEKERAAKKVVKRKVSIRLSCC